MEIVKRGVMKCSLVISMSISRAFGRSQQQMDGDAIRKEDK